MLQLVMGRTGTGKTTYIRSELVRRVQEGEKGIVLIVPEQFSFVCEKELLLALGEQKVNRVEVLTFTRLSDAVAREAGGVARKTLSDSERAAVMSLAIEAVQDSLKVYTRNLQSAGTVGAMLQMAQEMTACSVESEQMEALAGQLSSGILKDKLHDLTLITSMYHTLLQEHCHGAADTMTWLYQTLGNYPFFQGKTVALDAFHGFTAQEFQILGRIFRQSETVYLSLCADPSEQDRPYSMFAPVLETARQLRRIAKENGAKVATPLVFTKTHRYEATALKSLERGLFRPGAQRNEEKTDAVVLYEAQTVQKSCDYIARTAKHLMRTQGIRCREMAVIARDINVYRSELQSAFQNYGMPVFEDNRQPVASQPLMQFICAAFSVIESNFDADAMFAYLKTGLTGHSIDEISELENYTILWKVNGSRWLKEWKNHPNGFESAFSARHTQQLERINRIRAEVLRPLQRFQKACRDATGTGIAAAAFRLLRQAGVPKHLKALAVRLDAQGQTALALEQARVWDLLMELLDHMANILGERRVSAKRFGELLRLVIETQDMGHIPEGLDHVALGSADRMRPVNPKVVFLLGANEGEFPKTPQSAGVLSETERLRLKEAGLELFESREQMTLKERFWTYLSACAPTQRLYVTWAVSDGAGMGLSPSALVTEIRQMLPNCVNTAQSGEKPIELIEGESTAFALMARLWNQQDVFSATLKEYFRRNDRFSGKFRAVERTARQLPLEFQQTEKSTALFSRDMVVSASRVETFFHCPFQYFCQFGLNARPRRVAQMDPMQSGTVIHFVLEQLLREYGGKGLAACPAQERRTRIEELLKTYFETQLGAVEELGARFEYLFHRLADTIEGVAGQMALEFEQSQFEPAAFELEIGKDAEVEPVTIALPDGGSLSIRGQIDRVDLMKGDNGTYLRVVDYKSGMKQFLLSDVLYGLNMQMLIYLMCVSRNGRGELAGAEPAGVLYMPARRSLPNMERDAEEGEVDKEHKKDFRMNGLVLEDEEVVRAMERGMNGVFIPAKLTQSRGLTGTLISAVQLSRLFHRMESLLAGMGEELHRGKIAPHPAQGGNYNETCQWCDYKTVCAGQEQKQIRKIEKLDHKESLELLDKEGTENE